MLTLHQPIRQLPCKGSGGVPVPDIVVEAKAMTVSHVNTWHSVIQPIVDSHYQRWSPGQADASTRADVGWDWAHMHALVMLHNAGYALPGGQSGPAYGFALVIHGDGAEEVPIGMLTVVPLFNSTVFGQTRQRTFAWFLADAPGEFYAAIGLPPVLAVAKALLDTAIQSGLASATDGSLLLHADPAGGPKLPAFYGSRCGMQQLNAGEPAVSLLRRGHTDEYFHFDEAGATRFCQQFDNRR